MKNKTIPLSAACLLAFCAFTYSAAAQADPTPTPVAPVAPGGAIAQLKLALQYAGQNPPAQTPPSAP